MSLTVSVQDLISEASNPLLDIHPSWERVCLRDVATVLNGFAFPSKNFERAAGTPLIRIRDVGSASTQCRYKGAFDERYLVRAGDLIVGMDGDFRCARWQGTDALLNQRVCRVAVTSKQYLSEFLEIVLPAYLDAIRDATSSVTVAHLSSKSIAEIPLPLPPLAEQKRIVAKVEELLARVSAARERLARVPAFLRRFRQAVLAAAREGRLTDGWRDQERGSRPAAATARRVRGESGGSHVDEPDSGDLPESWRVSSFGALTRNFDGARIPIKASDREKRRGKYTYYGASGPIDTIDDFLFDGEFLLIGEDGANLLARSTPIAFRASGRFWVNNHAHVVQPVDGVLLRFLELLLNGLDLQEYVTGTAQPKMTQAALNRIPIRLPPKAEQGEIVRRVEALFKLADAIEKRVAAATARAEKLTQAILARAFRGELIPTEAALARRDGREHGAAATSIGGLRAERSLPEAAPRRSRRQQGSLTRHGKGDSEILKPPRGRKD